MHVCMGNLTNESFMLWKVAVVVAEVHELLMNVTAKRLVSCCGGSLKAL